VDKVLDKPSVWHWRCSYYFSLFFFFYALGDQGSSSAALTCSSIRPYIIPQESVAKCDLQGHKDGAHVSLHVIVNLDYSKSIWYLLACCSHCFMGASTVAGGFYALFLLPSSQDTTTEDYWCTICLISSTIYFQLTCKYIISFVFKSSNCMYA
jgi:hypothetical protein